MIFLNEKKDIYKDIEIWLEKLGLNEILQDLNQKR